MPTGPKGERRPAGTAENAMHMMKVATGEIEEAIDQKSGRVNGGKARAESMTPAERSEFAKAGARARWGV